MTLKKQNNTLFFRGCTVEWSLPSVVIKTRGMSGIFFTFRVSNPSRLWREIHEVFTTGSPPRTWWRWRRGSTWGPAAAHPARSWACSCPPPPANLLTRPPPHLPRPPPLPSRPPPHPPPPASQPPRHPPLVPPVPRPLRFWDWQLPRPLLRNILTPRPPPPAPPLL